MRDPIINVHVNLDTEDWDDKVSRMMVQLDELRAQMRPWWCPRWLYRLLGN